MSLRPTNEADFPPPAHPKPVRPGRAGPVSACGRSPAVSLFSQGSEARKPRAQDGYDEAAHGIPALKDSRMPELFQPLADFLALPIVKTALWGGIILIVTAVAARIAARALRKLLERDSNPLPSSSILVNIVRGVIWALGASVLLDACFGINANALVAALGVGGIAVSLGFQDTLSNLIGGLQVTFMGIVAPGDNIEVGSEAGVVQDVTWRHTTIRDAMGQTVIIPNSIISKTALVHLLPANRVAVPFAVPRTSEDGSAHSEHMDELAGTLAQLSGDAAAAVSPVIDGPRVLFSEISELGIKGKIILQVEDATKTGLAADAVVRAIAPLV